MLSYKRIYTVLKNPINRILVKSRNVHSVPPSSPFNVLFMGRDEFSCLVLNKLYSSPDVWSNIWVVTTCDTRIGRRGSQVSISPLRLLGEKLNLQTLLLPEGSSLKSWDPPAIFSDYDKPPDRESSSSSNCLLVTASFGKLIPNRILHLFPQSRRLNVHPSLLPLYRGPAPIQHTLMDGRDTTGVSILEMKEKRLGADVGEVWAQKTTGVPPGAKFSELRQLLALEGGDLLVSVLREMMLGRGIAKTQDEALATYAPMITNETGKVDFHTWDAQKIERYHRSISHQIPLTTTLPSGKLLQLHNPMVLPNDQNGSYAQLVNAGDSTYDRASCLLVIRCAGSTFVGVPQVKQQDRNLLNVKEWWNGVQRDWMKNGVLNLGK